MKNTRILVSALLLVAAGPAGEALAAQCELTDSITSCWTKGFQEINQQAQVQQDAQETKEISDLRKQPTGVETGGTALGSNTKNFLPLLAMSGLLGEVQEDEAAGTYTFDLNFLIPGLAKDKNAQLQTVLNSQPKVSESLAMKLDETTRDATVEKLQGTLGDLDDSLLSFTYNQMGRNRGRGFKQYENRFHWLAEAVSAPFKRPPSSQDLFDALGRSVRQFQTVIQVPAGQDLFLMSFEDIAKQNPAVSLELQRATEAALDQETTRLQNHRKALEAAGLELFGSLLDNQPQLHFSAQRRFRDSVVGGDETSFKITYEWAPVNFKSSMTEECHTKLDTDTANPPDTTLLAGCLSQYTTFVDTHKEGITDGNKFSFSAEYEDIGEAKIDRPEQGMTGIILEGANKLIISAGWTHLFPELGGDGQPLRLDLVALYEDVSDDPDRQDRGVATLTVTRKFGNLSIPFGIVYANHGEFLGEVNEKLSAHLGLKFDLFGDSPSEQAAKQ